MKEIWNKLVSWRVDLCFLVLLLLLASVYLLQPQRVAALRGVWDRLRGISQQLSRPTRVWVAPPDLDHFSGEGLARFGEELEFLGCDVAITQDRDGTHVWFLTLWRVLQPISTDGFLEVAVVPTDGGVPIHIAHRLGQQFLAPEFPTRDWQPGQVVIDAALLPSAFDPQADYERHIRVRMGEEGPWLPADTPFLEQDAGGWLTICQ